MFKKVAIVVIMIGLAFSCSYAEDVTEALPLNSQIPSSSNNQVQDNSENKQPETQPAKETIIQEGNVSLDFKDADIKNVLRILAYKSGVNIVAGPEVTGPVTIQLDNVPWQRALEVILSTYGYGYDQKGNIITVTTIEDLKKRREDARLLSDQEPLTTKTFVLNYAKVADVIKSIGTMKTSRGTINYDERTNTLIVRDTVANVELISGVLKTLDSTTPQVLIEAKIIETTLSNKENMGVDWTAQITLSGAKLPTTFPFVSEATSKMVPYQFVKSPAGASQPQAGAPTSATDFAYGTLNFAQLQMVLQLLKTRTDTNILSNPRIVTLDNQKANINVGSQYPIPTYTFNEQQARLQVSGWEYKDIGIQFNVTPHVNRAGYVTLEIEPKVTDILDYVTVENTQLPRLSNESAKTNVMVKDGETLVIAGLVKNKTDDVKTKVPFLGDIPIVGYVFQKSNKTVSKTELLLFLTPHIITSDNSAKK